MPSLVVWRAAAPVQMARGDLDGGLTFAGDPDLEAFHFQQRAIAKLQDKISKERVNAWR